ncbi:MAG: glutamine amidotransferase [Planctomycetota bacterium]
MFKLSLAQGASFLTMLAVAAVAIALVAVFYYRAFGMLPAGKWRLLLLLRSLAILIVVVLLFQPVLTSYKDLEEKPAVIFAIDNSASMGIADDATGVTRFNQARGQIENWTERLRSSFHLHLIEFSERAQPLESFSQLASVAPEGKATSISRALVAAANRLPSADVEAVILLSDGVHNSARSPLEVANRMGITVHTVGVGASLRSNASHRDIQITGIDCPERLMLNNMAQIKASVEGIGLEGRVVQVLLHEDDSQIGAQELTVDDQEGSQEVVFEYRPTNKGRHKYNVRVEPLGDEKIAENNQRTGIALVVEPGIRVLYVEGTLRAEYGAIVDRFLAKDPDLEFYALVQTRPNVFLRRTNIPGLEIKAIPSDAESINQFDVFVLGDLDASYLKPAQQDLIAQRVREGGGLIMLGGYHSLGPGGYEGTPIGEMLPVRVGSRDIGQVTEQFLPTLTPDGVRHPIFANISQFFPTQQGPAADGGLPALSGCTRVEAARPSATLLATYVGDATPMPVLAVQPLDKGRTAIFAGDTTRNWDQGTRAFDQESPFTRFWGQTVRWLAGRSQAVETTAGVVASTDKGYYEPEESVQLAAIVRNQEGQGAADASVVARVQGPIGRPEEVTLTAVPGPSGHYSGAFEPKAAGSYEVVIEAKVGDQTVESEKLAVEVGRPNLEFEKLDLDEQMLSQIAADTGGRYLHITAADHLIDQLDRTARKRREYFETELYWPPAFWTLFVAVITTEWLLRRRYQLR